MNPVKRRVIFTKAETYVDGGVKMAFVTSKEQTGALTAELFELKGTEIDMYLVAPGGQLELEVPKYEATNPSVPKSPSKALRDELWAYFSVAGLEGSFDVFYEKIMKAYLQHWLDKRMEITK